MGQTESLWKSGSRNISADVVKKLWLWPPEQIRADQPPSHAFARLQSRNSQMTPDVLP